MTPGQLVKAVALALDTPEETVTAHDRNLVVAGLRTKGGRGRSAPDVTPLDAARLLVAVVASVRIKDSVSTVRAFEMTRSKPDTPRSAEKFFDPAIMALRSDHNFIDAIAALISDASLPVEDYDEHDARFTFLGITCETPVVAAHIGRVAGAGVDYRVPGPIAISYPDYHGVMQMRRFWGLALMLLGKAFRDDGLNFKTTKEALAALHGSKKATKAKKKVG